MLTLSKYFLGVGDPFAHQARAQLRACMMAAEPGRSPGPIHDLFPPGSLRGWLEAADVSSSVFVVPTTIGDGGGRHEADESPRRPGSGRRG
jgi:hypothetical protein